jgi:hypothetical protein
MQRMGEFLLHMALERAHEQGVKASLLVRYGDLREELKAVAEDQHVSAVVLGKPQGEDSVFNYEELTMLAAEIEGETEADVHIL